MKIPLNHLSAAKVFSSNTSLKNKTKVYSSVMVFLKISILNKKKEKLSLQLLLTLNKISTLKMHLLTLLIASIKHKRSINKLNSNLAHLKCSAMVWLLKLAHLIILKLKFKLLAEENKAQMRDFMHFQKLSMLRDKSFMSSTMELIILGTGWNLSAL